MRPAFLFLQLDVGVLNHLGVFFRIGIHHRLLFRRQQKPYLVQVGNQVAIVAMAFLTVGFTGILVLISHVIFGATTAVVVGISTAAFVAGLWFGMPLNRRRHL